MPSEQWAEVVAEEQAALWSDLDGAIRSAFNGQWSIQCDWLVGRIVALAALVGPTPWEQVQVALLCSGVYEQVYARAGLDTGPIDWDRVAAVEASIAASVATVSLSRPVEVPSDPA